MAMAKAPQVPAHLHLQGFMGTYSPTMVRALRHTTLRSEAQQLPQPASFCLFPLHSAFKAFPQAELRQAAKEEPCLTHPTTKETTTVMMMPLGPVLAAPFVSSDMCAEASYLPQTSSGSRAEQNKG